MFERGESYATFPDPVLHSDNSVPTLAILCRLAKKRLTAERRTDRFIFEQNLEMA